MPRRPADAAALSVALRERRPEIEQAILTRIQNDGGPTEAPDPEYAEGLKAAVPAALDYCLSAVEQGDATPPPFPTALLSQARIASRNEIPLDTVLRRYFAGYALLGDFTVAEVERIGPRRTTDLKSFQRVLSANFERLLAAVSEEYARERDGKVLGSEQRRAAQVQRLLAGELLDAPDLSYDLAAHHVGAIAKGPGARDALRELAHSLDRRLLALDRGEDTVWAWLGGRSGVDLGDLTRSARADWPRGVCLAIGEPNEGLGGWRLTHRQARAALPIALRSPKPLVRYGDVALLAAILKDDLLATSLRELYLEPLEEERDGGETARDTLRAYFVARRNVSSAAVALGVSRNTVTSRLRAIEERLGRPLESCAAEFEAALRFRDLGQLPALAVC
jgi:hypothetical protein